jgi:hypothetical protein
MNNNISITKSDFLLFLEAPRHLWAKKHDLIDQTPSPFEINVMKQGYEVEALAKEYLEKNVLKPDENLIFKRPSLTINLLSGRIFSFINQLQTLTISTKLKAEQVSKRKTSMMLLTNF